MEIARGPHITSITPATGLDATFKTAPVPKAVGHQRQLVSLRPRIGCDSPYAATARQLPLTATATDVAHVYRRGARTNHRE